MTTTQSIVDLSDFAWERLRDRVQGLTDTEYFWEPFDGCWTVRDGVPDLEKLPVEPAPFTTLAWRITHIIDILQEERTATWFGQQPAPGDGEPPVPRTAEEAGSALSHAYDVWRRRLSALSQEDLDRPMGPIAGPFAEHDGTAFALHIVDELIHHGAEVGTVRDFYRGTHPEDPFSAALAGELTPAERPALFAEAAAARKWELLPQLADLGFEVSARTESGFTAAHLAAGIGDVEALRFLVERGADLSIPDARFQADVLGWAKWFDQPATTEYLQSL
ncbi:hypothetical protein HPO96_10505 [Kribbella sandramycini]|uniref:DinB-like domain-containing protein n=1 Tax=Kribbella sandramycini TaxID=60450 RepID=A0A7Y4KZF2_9ACTN|nr:DinB family protein [Kribbella sandramycini]MBB6569490.1 hypothetical protein [Kribbella sandramycini]NOL40676.1 hypothetical protein [Kribbella sandramycini]